MIDFQRSFRFLVLLGGICFPGISASVSLGDESSLTFERDIRPILRAHCLDCHGATDSHEGNLDLRLVRLMQQGGDSGPAIVSGKPDESLIIQRIRDGEMPPGEAKVPAEELKILENWIAAGAPTTRPEPESIGPGVPLLPEEREWWSFKPLVKPPVPGISDNTRIRTPVDSFLQAAMPEGLTFSPDAPRRTQMLRLCLDLTGLPPTPEQLQAFLNDDREDAYERLVDELLASPHYGERWGRHWLDVAGYADTEGGAENDAVRTWAYRYRDYVIRSFNSNKPFDRFIHEQLAGDELAGPIQGDLTPEQIELLTATGFLRMAADGTGSGNNTPEARNLVIADTLQIVSTSLLGLTVACAQCHDHRYDPISQTDYFALRAIFDPALDWQNWKVPAQRRVSLYTQKDREIAAEIEAEAQTVLKEKKQKQDHYIEEALTRELQKFEEPLREQLNVAFHTPADKRTPEQIELLKLHPSVNITPGVLYQYLPDAANELKEYDTKVAEIRAKKPPEEFIRALVEPAGHLPKTQLFHRGDYRQPKQFVTPAALRVLCPEDHFVTFAEDDPDLPTSGRRLAFARWLTSWENPITARVIVNRVWMHHFGKGLVETPADFGRLGVAPTHPELLDWLAAEFISSGWDLKHLHRLMVLSTAYRQSSVRDPQKLEIDDSNRYYWRKNVTRLDAEAVRDRMLSVSGLLDLTQFGPPVPVKEGQENSAANAAVNNPTPERRSLYIQQRRTQPDSMLQTFDAPVMTVNCERRPSSTVATQSLMMMNSPFVLNLSQAFANRILQTNGVILSEEQRAGLQEIQVAPAGRWQYGYGPVEECRTNFTSFPLFTEGSWRGGRKLPDDQLGWAFLNASGGHCGVNPDFAVIRRWTAPASGQVRVSDGVFSHASPHGDGVRGRIISSQHGCLGEWSIHNQQVETTTNFFTVEAGDTVDFVTDCRDNVNSDSFQWEVSLEFTLPPGKTLVSESKTSFSGDQKTAPLTVDHVVQAWESAYCRPPSRDELNLAISFLNRQIEEMTIHPRELGQGVTISRQALANLCQVLLTSNEFLYLD